MADSEGRHHAEGPTAESSSEHKGAAISSKLPSKDLNKALDLIRTNDDTSRFVGLALLKPVLEQDLLSQDSSKDADKTALVQVCWEALPLKFLDRLLKARHTEKRTQEEADNMVSLSIAVLRAFENLLPFGSHDQEFAARVPLLLSAIETSSREVVTQILELLLSLTYCEPGSEALLNCDEDEWNHLVKLAATDEVALNVVAHTFNNTTAGSPSRQNDESPSVVQRRFDETVLVLLEQSEKAAGFLDEHIAEFISNEIAYLVEVSPTTPWLPSVIASIRAIGTDKKITTPAKTSIVILAVLLLRSCPSHVAAILFDAGKPPKNISDWTPAPYLFIQMVLIDIRATIPSLLELLNNGDYAGTSARIGGCYDILAAFITFLIQSLGEDKLDQESPSIDPPPTLILPPALLLQLRADISETMSLTIEYFQDRLTSGPPLEDRSKRAVSRAADQLMLSQLYTLALWLRDDDNPALRKEAAALAPHFFDLYAPRKNEYAHPILIALEGILETPEGVEAFLHHPEFWDKLVADLHGILSMSPDDYERTLPLIRTIYDRGLQIVRILLKVVESDVTGPAKEGWMTVVVLASNSLDKPAEQTAALELAVAAGQLAVELLVRVPKNVRRRNQNSAVELLSRAETLLRRESIQGDTKDGLEEIVQGLEDLGFSSAGSTE